MMKQIEILPTPRLPLSLWRDLIEEVSDDFGENVMLCVDEDGNLVVETEGEQDE